jgi:hypothetical protein
VDALEELGFEWGVSLEKSWKNKLLALKTYKDTHGHARVPQSFVVPTDDQRWPIETHNMKLGKVVNYLRQRQSSLSRNQVDDLEALEFDWGVSLDEHWRKNLLALATYEEIYGHMRVPQNFVVPADDELWPEVTHGIKLGNVVFYLRLRKDSLSQNQIDALNFFGFEWVVVD